MQLVRLAFYRFVPGQTPFLMAFLLLGLGLLPDGHAQGDSTSEAAFLSELEDLFVAPERQVAKPNTVRLSALTDEEVEEPKPVDPPVPWNQLADYLRRQYEVGEDIEEWLALARDMANQDDAKAAFAYLQLIEMGLAQASTSREVQELLQTSAEGGHIPAQKRMAAEATARIGRDKEAPREAFLWHLKAAKQQDVESQLAVARTYFLGGPVQVDTDEGRLWLELAAHGGSKEAKIALARLLEHEENTPEALAIWQELANQGDPDAQRESARILLKAQDLSENTAARILLREAAHRGDHDSAFRLGSALVQEALTRKELVEGRGYLRQAARQGNVQAAWSLAQSLIESAQPNNHEEARFWLEQAAHRGHFRARNRLALMIWQTGATAADRERALQLWRESAQPVQNGSEIKESERREAQYRLGMAYLAMDEVPGQDLSEAAHWLARAAHLGHPMAAGELARLKPHMAPGMATAWSHWRE